LHATNHGRRKPSYANFYSIGFVQLDMDKCVNRPMQFWCFTTANVTEPLSVSLKATSTPRRAFVDTAPVNDKISQRLIQIFEFRGLPQHARPLLRALSSTLSGSVVQKSPLA
jgi:hypothetical protein